MIYIESALPQHPFDIAVAQLVAKIPANTKKNEFWFKVPPLEG